MISARVKERLLAGQSIRMMFEKGLKLKQALGEENVYDFSLGNPFRPPPLTVFQAYAEIASCPKTDHRYMPNAGYPETRQAISDMLNQDGIKVGGMDSICMTVGAAGAINVVFKNQFIWSEM